MIRRKIRLVQIITVCCYTLTRLSEIRTKGNSIKDIINKNY